MTFDEWLIAVKSENYYDRLYVIEEIPDAPEDKLIPILLELLEDHDSLIRVCVAEALGNYQKEEVIVALRRQIAIESDFLAKAYSISSLGKIGKIEDISLFLQLFESEKDLYLRTSIVSALFLCTHKNTTDIFVDFLTSACNKKDSGMQVKVVNEIREIYEEIHKKRFIIIKLLKFILNSEKNSVSMLDTINSALEEI